MADSDELTVESLQVLARQVGLNLTDAEASEALNGVARNREFARALRALVRPETEPNVIFHAPQTGP